MTTDLFSQNYLFQNHTFPGKNGAAMNAPKGLVYGVCMALIMFLLLKMTKLGYLLTLLREETSSAAVLNAWIEREEEEFAYQSAVRWEQVRQYQ